MKYQRKTNKAIQKIVSAIFHYNDKPVIQTAGQSEITRAILSPDIKRIWISTPTQYGKSLNVSISSLLRTQMMGGNEVIPIIAPTKTQSDIIMNYVIKHVLDSPVLYNGLIQVDQVKRLKTEFSKNRLAWTNGNEIKTLTANASSNAQDINKAGSNVMGFGGSCVIVDEASLIPDTIMFKILRMLGSNPDAKLILIGNPFNDNYFYNASKSPEFYKIHIDWRQAVAEGRFTQAYIDEMREAMTPEMFDILYETKFVLGTDDGFIKNRDIRKGEANLKTNLEQSLDEEGKNDFIKWQNSEPIKVGVDIARSSSKGDESVIILRQGYKILKIERLQTDDTMQIKGLLQRLQDNFNFNWENVIIDVVGVGAGLVDNLKELGHDVTGLNWGQGPDNEEMYYNMRSELWGIVREELIAGKLEIKDPDLVKQLLAPKKEFRYRKKGAVSKLESKEQMLRRGIKSPDIADALAYSYYEPQTFNFNVISYL